MYIRISFIGSPGDLSPGPNSWRGRSIRLHIRGCYAIAQDLVGACNGRVGQGIDCYRDIVIAGSANPAGNSPTEYVGSNLGAVYESIILMRINKRCIG